MSKSIIFIEIDDFLEDVSEDDEDYRELQNELLDNPTKGAVLEQCGGLRKIRMKLLGRGKSGGARVIYLHLPKTSRIVFFFAFTKGEAENISAEGKKFLRNKVQQIKEKYEKQQ